MARRRILAMLLLLATAFWPAAASAKWLRADTHNFIIYSSGSRTQLQEFATNVERFDALLRLRFHVEREALPNRLTIYLLARAEDVARLAEDDKRMIAGYYRPEPDGSFAVANRARTDSEWVLSGNTVLFHEYAHHFMFHNFTQPYPAWYTEGFAEYVSTTTFKENGEWTMGRPPYYRGYGLLQEKKTPIETLLFEGPAGLNREQSDVFYGRSWLLVHMLAAEAPRANQLETYMKAVAAGTPEREAAVAAFGDLTQLDKAMDRYLNKSTMQFISSKRLVTVDGAIQIAELDDTASQLVELGLKRRAGYKEQETRDRLRALAAQAPGNADILYELALAERAMGNNPEQEAQRHAADTAAEAAIDRALAANPNHARVNVLKAEFVMQRLRDMHDDRPAKWRDARAYILKANTADKLDPAPLIAWFDSFRMQGREPPQNARDGLAMAFSLSPEAAELRAKYAFELARQKKYDLAIRVAQVLAHDPHDGAQGIQLVANLKALRDADPGIDSTSAKPAAP